MKHLTQSCYCCDIEILRRGKSTEGTSVDTLIEKDEEVGRLICIMDIMCIL